MNLSRDGLSIANIFLKASVRLNLLKRTIAVCTGIRKFLEISAYELPMTSDYTTIYGHWTFT